MLHPGPRLTAPLLQEENAASLENVGEILSYTTEAEPKAFCWFTDPAHFRLVCPKLWMI